MNYSYRIVRSFLSHAIKADERKSLPIRIKSQFSMNFMIMIGNFRSIVHLDHQSHLFLF